jgi:predicted glycosyltransferase
VNYAVNGTGAGHVTRLIAINRWIRRYSACAGVRAEIYFLTSSEADGLLFSERFAAFKVPSKTVVGEAGIDRTAYLALAKQWVWHSLGLLRPDLLVVDTFPRGAFGELLSALDLCRTKAFIYRPSKTSVTSKPDFQAMLPLYDALIVPELAEHAHTVVPDSARSRLHYCGPVAIRETAELQTRDEARRLLGLPADRLVVFVSAGGGGDAEAERLLLDTCEALQEDESVHVVVGAGPLYRGRRIHAPRVTWLTQSAVAELHLAFDVAIAAAGYNTFTELMLAGVPTIFFPLDKKADDQRARAAQAVKAGAAKLLDTSAPDDVLGALDLWRHPQARQEASRAARMLMPQNHARTAAAALLKLVLPAHEVDAATELVNDEVLTLQRSAHVEMENVLTALEAIESHATAHGLSEAAEVRDHALALVRDLSQWGDGLPHRFRVLQQLGRKLPPGNATSRAAALREVLSALRAFDDWAGALSLVKLLGAERELTPSDFAAHLSRFLERLRNDGRNLYEGIARMAVAQGIGREQPSNRELLATLVGAE